MCGFESPEVLSGALGLYPSEEAGGGRAITGLRDGPWEPFVGVVFPSLSPSLLQGGESLGILGGPTSVTSLFH